MRWSRRGLLIPPPAGVDWAVSHAALPVVDPAPGRGLRIYLSSRDHDGRSQVGRAAVSLDGTQPVFDPEPLLRLGPLGTFDDRGVTTSCLVDEGGRRYLFYTGWTLGGSVPFHLAVGCAVSEDDGATFNRVSVAPVLDRHRLDPYLTASPAVLVEGGTWRMWYVSGTGWREKGGRLEPEYHIKYAESGDGVEWRRDGRVCIDYLDESEHAIARPCVVRDGSLYRMWFCSRGSAYRIGYAESSDGLRWRRLDPGEGLAPSASGWDSEMMAYPWVFDRDGQRQMLYNGNGFGRTGIGLAVLEPDVPG